MMDGDLSNYSAEYLRMYEESKRLREHQACRERIALECVLALLSGPHAFLWDDPEKLADKAVRHAEALIARLEKGDAI